MMKKMTFIFFVLLFITFGYIYIKANKNETQSEKELVISNDIEADNEIIDDYFASGMSKKNYKAAINRKTTYLEKKADNYENISYNFEKFLGYSEIETIIEKLNKSKAVMVEKIGESVDKRNLYSIEVGFGDNIIMFEAGIHAAEVANTMFIIKYIKDLVNDYEEGNEKIIKLLDEVKIIVLPSINPDGYDAVLYGTEVINNDNLYIIKNNKNILFESYKANANGVDLNRNLPSQHGGLYYSKYSLAESVSLEPSIGYFDYFPGNYLGSEPETRALMYWQSKYINNTYAYIALHSSGRVIYTGKPNLSDKYNENSLLLATIVNSLNNYIILDKEHEDVGKGDDGTATDFAAELASGFIFSSKTGRLSADTYQNPTINNTLNIGIITLETLYEYTFLMSKIKNEYYDYNLKEVFDELINSYKKIV